MQTYLKTKPVWVQLLLFLGMAFGLLTIMGLIGLSILSGITGISLMDIQNLDKLDPNNPNAILFVRGTILIQFLALFLIPTILFAYFSDPKPVQYLGLRRPFKELFWILAIAAMFVSIPLVEFAGVLNQKMSLGLETDKWMKGMEEEALRQIQFMLHKRTPSELVLNLIFISLFAGVGEELFFRGILQRLFIRAFKDPWAGIIMAAIIFSAFHLQFYGFFPRLILGIILGAVYWYSGSLWVSILAHFLYDALIIVLAYYDPGIIRNADQTLMDPSSLAITATISLILTIGIIWLMKKNSSASYTTIYQEDKPQTPFDF